MARFFVQFYNTVRSFYGSLGEMHHKEHPLNLKAVLFPGGIGALMAILFPIPATAVALVIAALFAWLFSWMANVAVAFYRREFSWGKCIGGLIQRIIAYMVLFAAGAVLTLLLGALLVEVPAVTQAAARRLIWAPLCVISSIVGFAETISLLRAASRLLPDEESARQVRIWLKPFTVLIKEIGERTIETQQNALRGLPRLAQGSDEKSEGGAKA